MTSLARFAIVVTRGRVPFGTQMNKQSKKVELGVMQHAALENNRAYLFRTEIAKSHLNKRICQHCGVKTSTVTPSFYYVFNISVL